MDPAKVGSTSSTMIFAIRRFRTLSNQWKVAAGRADVTMNEGSANHATSPQTLEKHVKKLAHRTTCKQFNSLMSVFIDINPKLIILDDFILGR
ncbi:hypothetical protein DXT90_17805 [Agrobacterium tumefaciens]|nr:hypothetical protein [Agrobacterium tumefaciens]